MNYSSTWFDALGKDLGLPIFQSSGVTGGRKVTVRDGAVTKGEVLRMCTDDTSTGVDTSKAAGPSSPQQNYEKLATGDGAAFDHFGVFAIALEAADEDAGCHVCDFGICTATVNLAAATYSAGTPLVADFTNQELVLADADGAVTSTGKVIALLATEFTAAGASEDALVIFSGLFPLGNSNINA